MLVAERFQDVLDGINPCSIEHTGIARHLPILVGQADRVAQRVDFPLALMQFVFHVGHVALPFTSAKNGFHVEGIGKRVYVDAGKLTVDDASHHLFQVSILIGQLYVRPNLSARVTQPHGVDIARIHKGVGLARQSILAEVHGSVQGVGETVAEHPRQLGVFQPGLHLLDGPFYGIRTEQAFLCGGALVTVGDSICPTFQGVHGDVGSTQGECVANKCHEPK